MKYNYFFSYSYVGGFGMVNFRMDRKIYSFSDIQSVAEEIKKNKGIEVVILNWKELETEE